VIPKACTFCYFKLPYHRKLSALSHKELRREKVFRRRLQRQEFNWLAMPTFPPTLIKLHIYQLGAGFCCAKCSGMSFWAGLVPLGFTGEGMGGKMKRKMKEKTCDAAGH